MRRRKLLFTSLALLVVLCSAPDLAATSRLRPVEPKPPDAPLAGMYLGSAIQISPGWQDDGHLPAVAYDSRHDEYLAVWHEILTEGGYTIWGCPLSQTGNPLIYWEISGGGLQRHQRRVPGGLDVRSRSYQQA